jgi:hypothetical protein
MATVTPVFPCNIVYVLYLVVSYRFFEEKKLFYSLYKHLIKKNGAVQHEMVYRRFHWIKENLV